MVPVSSMHSHLEALVQHPARNAVKVVGAFVQHPEENASRLSTPCMLFLATN